MTGYYDIILGLIPLSLGGITGLLMLAGLELTTAVPIAALVSVGLIVHGLFVNGPVDATTPPAPNTANERPPKIGSAD
ncbi:MULTISPECIES: hypothetical protein [unclassified Haladaptatus]|uniref:hypothetical protein n=1 Tax=unclassified Haladaptatus TaxID=2622732 RepID=UPI0023E8A7FE|nr:MULTISPECIES: hypothetical protein [unclassified Haladaptatus]